MKRLFFIFLIIVTSCSDNEDLQKEEDLTFEDLEVLFKMKTSFSDNAKIAILDKYGSADLYYEYTLTRLKEINSRKAEGMVYSKSLSDYTVTLYNYDLDLLEDINCYEDEIILDTAENNGIELPYSDRAGASTTCAGRQHSGTPVDQSEQTALEEHWVEAGYVLLCVAYPTSDCTIETHVEEDLY